ncbi:phage baseplate assembly protein V [Burkholderia stagnalis]|uniref:phage baseplate assembly protein V n=1 Tax=Burkholderia stagnalis TaxID=1503054 RepID=UPI000F55A3BD|nr:phage baseplate assembly protein V [Burkholderia stagnalis]RQQ73133.1 phage baseplate assembly protein V [Burkholderia stagnalis]RQQ74579.1 phage baseplate assembly protein V [Burkholderia stagnalis]RQQ86779.1 phage baseplate assembly protein V [Burkholderia stagnalis]RQQ95479.1 phage baseplate assembly protein V [Burkholderia stagnalis]
MDDFADLNRRLESLLREGTVIDVDHGARRVRVESGGLQTDWIRWLAQRTGNSIEWDPPSIGEPGLLLCPSGEPTTGLFLPGVYCDGHDAPSSNPNEHLRVYPDSARIAYDFAAHALTATLPAGATVHVVAPGSVTVETNTATVKAKSVTLDADDTTVTGSLLVKGPLTFESGATGKDGRGASGGSVISIQGSAHFTGTVTADVDVQSQGVSLVRHPHQAQGEFAETSKPIAGGA